MESFKAASAHASSSSFPDSSRQKKLQLYGLFKQATKGTATGSRPGVFDAVGRAKFDAWAACESFTQDEARTEYVALVSSIDPSFTLQPPDTSSTAPLAAAEPSATANGSTAADGEIPSSSAAPNEPTAAAAGVKGNDNSNNSSKSSSGGSTSNTSVWIRDIDVPKFTDLEDEQGFRYTVYNVRVTQSDDKVWTIGRRYNEIADLHATLLGTDKASSSSSPNKKFSSSMAIKCRHPDFVSFKFPNKSMFNTFAGHTLERRRQGFADFFKVLLKLIRSGDSTPISSLATLLSVPASALAQLLPNTATNKQASPKVAAASSPKTKPTAAAVAAAAAEPAATTARAGAAAETSATTAQQKQQQQKQQKQQQELEAMQQKSSLLTSETLGALEARSKRRALHKKNRGFSFRRIAMALGAIAAGFAWSAFWGVLDVSKVDWTRLGVATVLLSLATILVVDFLFMGVKG